MSTITNLAKANIRKDRTRSILITISIFLTTLLLAAVSCAGYGLVKLNVENAAVFYGDFYGIYGEATAENIREMKQHSAFAAVGESTRYAEVDSARHLTLNWLDEPARDMTHMESVFIEGHYPEKENEIAAAPDFFRQLGLEQPKIGDKVTVYFRCDLKSVFAPEEFVICGLLKQSGEMEVTAMSAYTAKEHFEKNVAEADRRYNAVFRLDESVHITNDNAEEVMKELAAACGIAERNVRVNSTYLMWKLDPGTETLTVCVIICAVVILFSVIVIYNIFQVGVVQKIQEYGKLKAVGTTRRQMKQVIFREGMYLACIGVPLGLVSGVAAATAALSYIIGNTGVGTSVLVVNIPLLALTAALAFFSVWIALKKPMRMAASISPVEAMRYQGRGKHAGCRKGKKALNLVSLTFANLSSHKRRTISTILSMGLSCVLFIMLANCLGNMDEEYIARDVLPHGQFQLELTFRMNDEAYPENNLNHVLEENPLNEDLAQKIRAIPEVTDIRTQSILYAKQLDAEGRETGNKYSILVLDREDFEWKAWDDELKGLDYDEVSAQDAVCYGWSYFMEDDGFAVGGTYHFSVYDGVQEKEWNPQMAAAFGHADADMIMTRDTYEKLGFTGTTTYDLWVDCHEKDVETVKEELKHLVSQNAHIALTSYQDELQIARLSMRVVKVPTYLFCVIIAFISFMNMANTMITSIVTRKQEFGVLQAVGMTNAQLDRSLQLEGIFFSLGTAVVSLAAGIPLGYMLFRYCKSQGFIGISIYHFPVKEVLFILAFLGILQTMLSFILSRNVKKESLVERIRYHG